MTAVEHAQIAAVARSNLHAWGAVVALLEGGILSGNSTYKSAQRVIKIAKAEMQKHLREYDAALLKVKSGSGKEKP